MRGNVANPVDSTVLLRPTVYEYDLEKFDLPSAVAKAMGVDDLSSLGVDAGYGRFTRATDQSTHYHQLFYRSFEQLRDLYRAFVQEVAGRVIAETFCFQRVPTFRVHLPGNVAVGEFHSDGQYNHPEGEINFWVPLTEAWGSNTVWIERAPMEGGYAPAPHLRPGQFLVFDAVRWRHGNVENDTGSTRVSFDFRCIPLSQYRHTDARSVNTRQRLVIGDYFEL